MLKLLLDTNVVIRFATDPGKLSREQKRVIADHERTGCPFGISAISLMEIAILHADGSTRIKGDLRRLIDLVDENPLFRILPVTVEIAQEVAAFCGFVRDPADRALVATARVHRLKLLTADQRIAESQLVPVIS